MGNDGGEGDQRKASFGRNSLYRLRQKSRQLAA